VHFWSQGDLPDAVVKHVAAMASRMEYRSIEAARDAAGGIPTDAVLALDCKPGEPLTDDIVAMIIERAKAGETDADRLGGQVLLELAQHPR
jgi:hypothetical protein